MGTIHKGDFGKRRTPPSNDHEIEHEQHVHYHLHIDLNSIQELMDQIDPPDLAPLRHTWYRKRYSVHSSWIWIALILFFFAI